MVNHNLSLNDGDFNAFRYSYICCFAVRIGNNIGLLNDDKICLFGAFMSSFKMVELYCNINFFWMY